MVFFTQDDIDNLISEDVPYFDLTSSLLDIDTIPGKITYSTRDATVVCCVEEVERIMHRFGLKIISNTSSGKFLDKDVLFLEASGPASYLHVIWKVTQNILEYSSGIATRTYKMVKAAREVNPDTVVVTTRKHFPGSKKLCIKGIIAGGAMPHRLGISETILIFRQHMNFIGGVKSLLDKISDIKKRIPEKKITVEVESIEDAIMMAKKGVDIIQFDKLSPDEIKKSVPSIKQCGDQIKIAAAGGVNLANIKEYVEAGSDIIVLSSAYFGKPADIKVRLTPLGDKDER